MNEQTEKVLSNIRKIRDNKRLSQETVGLELGIDGSTYSKIENGKIDLTYDRLADLARFFEMSIIDLITHPNKYIDENEKPELRKVKATLQIELDHEKKDQVLKLVFGENNLEILNK